MRVDAVDQKLAEEMGEGIWFLNGTFYELYQDDDKDWHVNVSWGAYAAAEDYFSVLPDLQAEAIKLDQRHFDAIERVNAPVETVQAESLQVDTGIETGAEAIAQNLFVARTVSDEEVAIGFIEDPETHDMYRVVVQYIGNRPND